MTFRQRGKALALRDRYESWLAHPGSVHAQRRVCAIVMPIAREFTDDDETAQGLVLALVVGVRAFGNGRVALRRRPGRIAERIRVSSSLAAGARHSPVSTASSRGAAVARSEEHTSE